jgi:plastocyanin
MARIRVLAVAAAFVAAVIAVAPEAGAASQTVSIKNVVYSPSVVVVSAGDTVTWTNEEELFPHDVTSGQAGAADMGQRFVSAPLNPGETFSHAFSEPGEYAYVCALHPSMIGTVMVTSGGVVETGGVQE